MGKWDWNKFYKIYPSKHFTWMKSGKQRFDCEKTQMQREIPSPTQCFISNNTVTIGGKVNDETKRTKA